MTKVTSIAARRGYSYVLGEFDPVTGIWPYRILNPNGTVACIGGYGRHAGKPATEQDADDHLLKTVRRLNTDAGYKTGRHSRKSRVVDGKPQPTQAHDWKRPIKETQA